MVDMNDLVLDRCVEENLLREKYSPAFKKVYQAMCDLSGEHCDSGGGFGTYDIWVNVDGVELYVQVQPSNNQKKKDTN